MNYYWTYYLASFAFAYATNHPEAAGVALLFWLCRGFLPDPVLLLRSFRRISRLKAEIAINPSNMVATRDLARLYIERKRPGKAVALIEQVRQRMAESTRHPQGTRDDADLLYHLGLAKFRSGDPSGALEPLVAAVAIAPDVARGEAYLVAADALVALRRWEEAEDALERSLEHNQSSVAVYVKIARVRAKRKDASGATDAIEKAKTTWAVLPSFKRRHEWQWYVAAVLARVWL